MNTETTTTISAKQLNKLIDGVGTSFAKSREHIQTVLCKCASRAYDDAHRDVDGFTRLVHNPKIQGLDLVAIIKWVKLNTPALYDAKKETPYGLGGFTINKSSVVNLTYLELLATPWWEKAIKAQQAAEVAEFSFDKAIAELVKRAAAAQKKGLPITGHGPIAEMLAKVANVDLYDEVGQQAA